MIIETVTGYKVSTATLRQAQGDKHSNNARIVSIIGVLVTLSLSKGHRSTLRKVFQKPMLLQTLDFSLA